MKKPHIPAADLFAGDSPVHALLRAHDWSNSPLGPPETWPPTLITVVKLMLASKFPMFVCWGPQFATLYNAACIEMLGARHPAALGRPHLETWEEIRGWLEPVLQRTRGGESIYYQNLPLVLTRNGYQEQAWFTVSHSPLQDEEGEPAGVYCVCTETTETVLAQARQAFHLDLIETLRGLSDPDAILATTSLRLADHLAVSRVVFGDFDPLLKTVTYFASHTDGTVPALQGAAPVADLDLARFAETEHGQTWVAHDLSAGRNSNAAGHCRSLAPDGIKAAVVVPVGRQGEPSTCLCIHHRQPRRWTPAEITLIEEVAKRAWTAVARSRAEKALQQRDETLKLQLVAEKNHLQQLFSRSPGFMALHRGPLHIYEMVNQSYAQLVGHRDLIGKPIREAVPELKGQGYFELLDSVFSSKKAFVGREMKVSLQRVPNGPGEDVYVDLVLEPMLESDGSVSGIFAQGHEVTAHKLARDEVRITNERWQLAIESTGDGVWDWHADPDRMVYSLRMKELLGYSDTELPDLFEEWERCIHPEEVQRVKDCLHACLAGTIPKFRVEYRVRCRDGGWKWMESHGMVVQRNAEGRATRTTGTLSDISLKKQTEAEYWNHANFDILTGLPNRRLFRDRLDENVKKATRKQLNLALLFIDLDRFKEANDLLGHDVGDLLLIEASKRIAGAMRTSDTVARLGGDEFTVILNDWERQTDIEHTAQKILAALAQPFLIGHEVVYLSASIGITRYSEDARSSEELIKNADQAMYAAKSAGRNRFSYFTRAMQDTANLRFRLSSDLRQALGAGQLEVYYQPIIELASGRIAKAEALLRWHHPKWGMVEPAQFIPIAEETGQITAIGNWVFKQAAACAQRWGAQRRAAFQIAVNKSPVQFLTSDEGSTWFDHLTALGLTGSSLAIEITEGLLLNASPVVSEKLTRYRNAGIEIALDDFGTGYSSMAYLKKFDIDYVKIDRSFIKGIPADQENWAIAESIILMARRLGLKVVAEGIETEAQKALLVAAGCDYGQGFLFSEAVPADQFERLLADGRKFT